MNKLRKRCTAFIIGMLLTAMAVTLGGCKSAEEEQKEFDDFMQELFEEEVTADTLTLHYTLAYPEEYGITAPEVTYGDVDFSEEALSEEKKELEDTLHELTEFNYKKLTDEQKLNYDILLDELEMNLQSYDYVYLYEPFAYTSGLQANLPITLSEYTFYRQQDVEDYLKLLELMPEVFQSYLDFERVKSEKGLFMSESCADEVIRQCSDYIAAPEENVLIETFNDRIGDVEGLSAQQIEEYKKQNHDAVIGSVIPAYENAISTFEELKTTGKNELGLMYLENGKEYYQYLLRTMVGTDKKPEEVIERLDSTIDGMMADLYNFVMSNNEAYMDYVENWESIYGEMDPEETIRTLEDAFSDRFPEIPEITFTVRPVHKSLEASVSPAFYMTPAMDDYQNNSIYINGGSDSVGGLWSTLAHEGIPGHMYQFVYFLASEPEPLRTVLNFNGYTEGWATYVEMMSYEEYDYGDKNYEALELINGALNMLVSARVEIGVNYEGWTLEQTKSYLSEKGFDASIAEDVMNYVIAEPVNYQMYCTGWLEFEELRSYAEETLQDKFDETAFHKVLLDAGPCQFYILEDQVKDYVESVQK